jgi:hypothetical protein
MLFIFIDAITQEKDEERESCSSIPGMCALMMNIKQQL